MRVYECGAYSPGGGSPNCDSGMGPVYIDPPPPQQVLLQPGPYNLFIEATSWDENYHFGAWYRFELNFATP